MEPEEGAKGFPLFIAPSTSGSMVRNGGLELCETGLLEPYPVEPPQKNVPFVPVPVQIRETCIRLCRMHTDVLIYGIFGCIFSNNRVHPGAQFQPPLLRNFSLEYPMRERVCPNERKGLPPTGERCFCTILASFKREFAPPATPRKPSTSRAAAIQFSTTWL